MGEEEVVVRVRQESVGGNVLGETAAEIERLRNAARNYDLQGMGTAAQTARADANNLEREMRRQQTERERVVIEQTRRRQQAEQVASNVSDLADKRSNYADRLQASELRAGGRTKEAEALEKAVRIRERAVHLERDLALSRREATVLAEREVNADGARGAKGGGGLGGITSLLGGISIAGIAHAFVGRVANDWFATQRGNAAVASQGIENSNRAAIIGGLSGVRGEGEAQSDYLQKRKQLEDAKAKRGTFAAEDQNFWDQFKVGARLKKGEFGRTEDQQWETTGERMERENNATIASLEVALQQAGKQAEQKSTKGTFGLELERQRQVAAGNMEEARTIEHKVLWMRRFNEAKDAAGGNAKIGAAAADVAVQAKMREEAGNMAHLVTARDGSRDTAAVAALAREYRTRTLDKIHGDSEIAKLRGDMNSNHREVAQETWRHQFARKTKR